MKNLLSRFIPSHITSKLSLLVVVLLSAAFTLFEVYNFLNTKSEITQKINTDQYAQARFIAKDIKDKIDKRAQFISGLADIISPETVQSKTLLLKTLKDHLRLTQIFPQGFAVISPYGKSVIAEYPVIPGRNKLSFTHSEWFIRAKNNKDVVISVPFVSRAKGELIIIMAKAIRDQEGTVLAVLEAPIFLNYSGFMGYVFDENHRQQGDVLVISRELAIFVASSDPELLLKPTPALGVNIFHDAVMDGFNGYDQSISRDGAKMLAAAADINGPDWFVIVRTPIDEAYKSLHERFHSGIANGIFVSLIALFTITFTLFIFFSPLRKAARTVKAMVENTQPLAQIKIYKNDEIGELIAGFNLLIEMVNERNINLNKANLVLESLSQTDGLTGVANRRYFDETLQHVWRILTRNQKPLTLLLIDIDYFKKYNDTYGHTAGDDCLKNVTKAIQSVIHRPTDFFARYGGEEFVILLQGELKEGSIIAEKAGRAVSDLQMEHSGSYYKHLTISLGVASIIPEPYQEPVELIKQADQALYASKANGRNRYELYHDIKN